MATTERHTLEELAPSCGGLYNVGVVVSFYANDDGGEAYREWTWTGALQICGADGEWRTQMGPRYLPRGLAECIRIAVDGLPGPYDHLRPEDERADQLEEEED
jgi:hypothetical protein